MKLALVNAHFTEMLTYYEIIHNHKQYIPFGSGPSQVEKQLRPKFSGSVLHVITICKFGELVLHFLCVAITR